MWLSRTTKKFWGYRPHPTWFSWSRNTPSTESTSTSTPCTSVLDWCVKNLPELRNVFYFNKIKFVFKDTRKFYFFSTLNNFVYKKDDLIFEFWYSLLWCVQVIFIFSRYNDAGSTQVPLWCLFIYAEQFDTAPTVCKRTGMKKTRLWTL